MPRPEGKGFLFPLAVVALAAALMVFPQQSFTASLRGLKAWWEVVLPSLLPFFIVSELLLGLGVVHFLGVLLEPLMRPFFNLPGCGSFVLAMGYTSGAPISAVLTAGLRRQGLLSRQEAERLVSFTNNASPLFLMAAVPVGMLGYPALGPALAGAHYLANLALGIYWGQTSRRREKVSFSNASKGNLLLLAARAMRRAQREDGRAPGQLLGDAIRHSMQTLSTIGGFIILFSVLIQLFSLLGILPLLARMLSLLFVPLGLDRELMPALAGGLLEMTNGTQMVALTGSSLFQKAVAISLVTGWAGLSVHAQVASILASTDLRLKTYFATRIGQAALSSLLVFALMRKAVPTFKPPGPESFPPFWQMGLYLSLAVPLFLLLLGVAIGLCKTLAKALKLP